MEDVAFVDDLFGKPVAVADPPRLWGVWFENKNESGWARDGTGRPYLSYDRRVVLATAISHNDNNEQSVFSVREVDDDGKPLP